MSTLAISSDIRLLLESEVRPRPWEHIRPARRRRAQSVVSAGECVVVEVWATVTASSGGGVVAPGGGVVGGASVSRPRPARQAA